MLPGTARALFCPPMTQRERVRLGKMHNPVRGLLHGSSALASVVGIVVLVLSGSDLSSRLALAVFGVGLLTLYTISSLYHSVPWKERSKLVMQRLDHSAVFVLIAASYTPIAVIAFDGWLTWTTLSVAWGITLVAASQHAFFPRQQQTLSIALAVTLGWLGAFLAIPMIQELGPTAITLIAVHGLLYTVGMVFMVTGWPTLWPHVFSAHEVFHVFTVLAGGLMFYVTVRYVAPLA